MINQIKNIAFKAHIDYETIPPVIPITSRITYFQNQPYQTGLVREFNSNKKPLEGVAINFFSALSTDSDADGKFTIVFTKNKKLGDREAFKGTIKEF